MPPLFHPLPGGVRYQDKRAPVMDINETFISRGRDNQEPYWKGWKQKVTTRALKL